MQTGFRHCVMDAAWECWEIQTFKSVCLFVCSGSGWSSVDPVCASELQARVAEGEFWLDETEFLSQFDDVTVGYPISEGGQLKSLYTGNSLDLLKNLLNSLTSWSSFKASQRSSPTGNLLTHNQQLAGRWTEGHSAGGSRNSGSYSSNPKFWLKVCGRGEVLVSLLQHRKRRTADRCPLEDGKNTAHQHYQAIALHMWKVCAVTFRGTFLCVFFFSLHSQFPRQ